MPVPGYREAPTLPWRPDAPVDTAEAAEFLRQVHADNPNLGTADVRPESLPPSFRLSLDDPAAADLVESEAESLDGVGQIVVPDVPADQRGSC